MNLESGPDFLAAAAGSLRTTMLPLSLFAFALGWCSASCGKRPGSKASFTLATAADHIDVVQGSSLTLGVSVLRSHSASPIAIAVTGLPPGATAAALTIGADQTAGTLAFSAAPGTAQTAWLSIIVSGSSPGSESRSVSVQFRVRGTPGSLDTTFGGGAIEVDTGFPAEGDAVAVDTNGRIVVAGALNASPDPFRMFAVRLQRDGQLDASFANNGVGIYGTGNASSAQSLALQPDGKIILAGTMNGYPNQGDFGIVRLNTEGTLDPSFGTAGVVDTDFGAIFGTSHTGYGISAVRLLVDGRIAAVGETYDAGNSYASVARFLADGSLDSTFGTSGDVRFQWSSPSSPAYAITDDSNGRLLVAGRGEKVGGSVFGFGVARLGSSGVLDSSFGGTGLVVVTDGDSAAASSIALFHDGSIVVAGSHVATGAPDPDLLAIGLASDGTPNSLFGSQGVVRMGSAGLTERCAASAVDTQGRVVLIGLAGDKLLAARLGQNGQPDVVFNGGASYRAYDLFGAVAGYAMAFDHDGRIVVAGKRAGPRVLVVRIWE